MHDTSTPSPSVCGTAVLVFDADADMAFFLVLIHVLEADMAAFFLVLVLDADADMAFFLVLVLVLETDTALGFLVLDTDPALGFLVVDTDPALGFLVVDTDSFFVVVRKNKRWSHRK